MSHLSDELMTTATSFKDEGNVFFSKGNNGEAVRKYGAALALLIPTLDVPSLSSNSPPSASNVAKSVMERLLVPNQPLVCSAASLTSILFSNGAQALFDAKLYARSALWAECAYTILEGLLVGNASVVSDWPTADVERLHTNRSKALFRQVRALNAEGFSFQAFILLHQVLLPLMANGSGGLSTEAKATLGNVPSSIQAGMKLSDLHEGFGLTHSETAGMSTIATQKIVSEQVIFDEKQLELPKLKASDPAGEQNTTAELVAFYAGQIHAVVTSNDVVSWNGMVRAMVGSWPRTLDSMDPSIVQSSIEAVSNLPKKAGKGIKAPPAHSWQQRSFTSFVKGDTISVSDEEVAHLALICRYNCFHSGFFRVCALANHSCDPNAAMKYVASMRKVVMVAVKDIQPGEAITVKYFADLEYMMGVGRRRELLHKSWLFWCDCRRCARDLGVGGIEKAALTHESVVCAACAAAGRPDGYVFLPTPGLEQQGADTLLPSSGTCQNCSETTTFEGNSRRGDLHAMAQAVEGIITIVQSGADIETVMKAVSAALAVLRPIVHRDHWSTRIILYCFCLYLHSAVSRSFEIVTKRMMPLRDTASPLFTKMQIDIAADLTIDPKMTVATNGGDALVCVLDLWRRIEPFYPPSQGWALHTIVCKLVCFNLMMQGDAAVGNRLLSQERCLELLAHHAPHCGQQESTSYFRLLTAVRGTDAKNAWSAETHEQLKVVLGA